MKPVAIQLYTVRDACAKDFFGTLKKIADIGYKGVEFAGLHGAKPAEVAKVVKDLGLAVSSSHAGLPAKDNVAQIVDQEKTLGSRRIVTGFGPNDLKTADDCKKAADRLNAAAELVKPHGMEIGYHNHWWEFSRIGTRTAHEILFSSVADNVFAQIDVYWTAYGKSDPVKVVKRMAKRVPLLHLKDGTLEENKPHTAIGSGKLDMAAIIGAADPKVLDWLIVELDSCETDMMEAVRQSYIYLTSHKLAQGNK